MKNHTTLTGYDFATILVCVVFLCMNLFATSLFQREMENRVICGTHLKGLGNAHAIYANDWEDDFVRQGGRGNAIWSETTEDWDDPEKDWSRPGEVNVTVGASLYLLVCEVDVLPEYFVCPSSIQTPYEGQNIHGLDLYDLWDFGSLEYLGTGPRNCVSYSFHMPYGRYPADGMRSATFAVMADKNPWYDSLVRRGEPTDYDWKGRVGYIVCDDLLRGDRDWQLQVGNAVPHQRDGQNVLCADGHVAWAQRSDTGVLHDNIYTIIGPEGDADAIRIGRQSEPYGIGYGEPTNRDDSFLVNDDEVNPCVADQPGDVNKDCRVDVKDLAVLSEHWLESTSAD
ncbi:MAG: hypothetical protein JXA82_09405 [Sedimentisphaerales bacterium]|nr:hypothetical protein [Sedimentisphaerales bacterium]